MANFFLVVSCLLLVSYSGCGDLESTLASLTIFPSSTTVGVRQYQLFSVVGHDSLGKIVTVSPSFSTTGGLGDVTATGVFIAGSVAGTGSVVAAYGGKSASATVTVTDRSWVAGRVIDSAGARVPDLKVYLKNTSYFDLTDSLGDYSISNVPAGTYEVLTLETGVFRAASYEVTVASGETKTVNFTISYFTTPVDLNPPELELD